MLRTSAREDTCWPSRRSATSSSSSCQPPGPSRWHHPTSSDHPSSLKAQQNNNTWNKWESYLNFKEFPSLRPFKSPHGKAGETPAFPKLWPAVERVSFLSFMILCNTPSNHGILLMEEILHHLGCRKPCKIWNIHHINWLAVLLNRQPYLLIH